MSQQASRREFLKSLRWGGAAVAAAEFGFLARLPRVSAEEARVNARQVQFDSGIEPLVRLIEESPRDQLLERVAERIHHGTSYREVLAALLLAGVRNVQPRPAVGFKFHCVLVVNACHLASLSGPDSDRWLPIFWALDYFKTAQADEASKSGWRMPPVRESLVPDASRARAMFCEALERWDVDQADAATAGLVRTAPATEVFQLFARYAARDFRAIGHKAIFLANAWRTLQTIGWRYAEPVLRSLTFALLNHTDEPNPATADLEPDRPWRRNAELIGKIPAGWLDAPASPDAARELCALCRTGGHAEVVDLAVRLLEQGAGAQSIWDGVFVGAGELLMRQPAIVALHGLTTANAVRYLWRHTGDEDLRRRLLLQACAFNALFRQAAERRGSLRPLQYDAIAQEARPGATLEDVFASVSRNPLEAASQLYGHLAGGGEPEQVAAAARRLIFLKGRDSHDYKFSSAVLEDYQQISPDWRSTFLALSVFNLKGTGDRDSGLVERTRAALRG